MPGVLKEFREFISRGNVIELAVAVVIGVAFNNLVNTIVAGLISPLIGIFGGADFGNLVFTINDSRFHYGLVINALIQFLAIAAAVFFLVVKPMNMLAERRRRGQEPPEELPEDVALLREIRDLLAGQAGGGRGGPGGYPPGPGAPPPPPQSYPPGPSGPPPSTRGW